MLSRVAISGAVLSSCVCPPCPETAVKAPIAVGAKLVLWNGDGQGQGSNPKAWESCDAKPCAVKLAPLKGEGRDGSSALHMHAEGSQYLGAGWNLYGWWPADAGTDLSGYDTFSFWVRFKAATPEAMADEFNVGLSGTAENKSAFIGVSKFDKNFNDGEWHLIEIPFAELQKGDGKNFKPQSVWELDFNTWTATPKNFDVYIDDIAVTKKQ
jgi:hypothetical protein